jgi:hypothetical protein
MSTTLPAVVDDVSAAAAVPPAPELPPQALSAAVASNRRLPAST